MLEMHGTIQHFVVFLPIYTLFKSGSFPETSCSGHDGKSNCIKTPLNRNPLACSENCGEVKVVFEIFCSNVKGNNL